MGRPPISPIKVARGNRCPSLCVFIDCETVSGRGDHAGETVETFKLACAVKVQRERGKWCRRECRTFTSGRDIWDWIHGMESRKRPIWVFAHNLGFDLAVSGFFDHVLSGRWSARDLWPATDRPDPPSGQERKPWRGCVVLTDPPTILTLRSAVGSLRLVDTCNYLFAPLADMGVSIGLPKLPQPASDASESEWMEYCKRDIGILERSVCGWIDRWAAMECGAWATTAAGLGYRGWRSTLNGKKVVPDQSPDQIELARSAYYGGQTEVYYCGSVWPAEPDIDSLGFRPHTMRPGNITGPVYHLDVHSLYPSVMSSRPYPTRYLGIERKPSLDRLDARSRFHLPIARVFVRSETDTYPVRREGQYLHAVGSYTTCLCGDELLGAIRRGHVVACESVAWYAADDLFSAFVSRWIGERHQCEDRGDWSGATLAKIVMNSLSGKFAQYSTVWTDCPDIAALHRFGEWEAWDATSRKLVRYRAFGGLVQRNEGRRESRQSFPAIAAHITANGRERMRCLRGLCPDKSVLYMDTDSLMVTQAGYDALCAAGEVRERELGYLRLKDVWPWMEIKGFKFYCTPHEIVCPGLKKDARIDGPGVYIQDRFERLSSILSRYQSPEVRVTDLRISPTGKTNGRTTSHSGWTTAPRLTAGVDTPF